MSVSISTATSLGRRSGAWVFSSHGGAILGSRHHLHLALQQRPLVGAQPAVEQVDRLAVAEQAQRVDEPDRAEEVALVGDAVEGGVRLTASPSGGRRANGSSTCQRQRSRALITCRSSRGRGPRRNRGGTRRVGDPDRDVVTDQQPAQKARVDAVVGRARATASPSQ